MSVSGDRILSTQRDSRVATFRTWALILVPFAAILFQTYLPLFFPKLAYLEAILLVTIYFAMMRHSQVGGILIGAAMGLIQDSLAHTPIGMFGIAKTLVGFFAASIGLRIDVSQPFVRLLACFVFYQFHQFLYWLIARALLGQQMGFDWRQNLIVGALNAIAGVALFRFLDKLKERD